MLASSYNILLPDRVLVGTFSPILRVFDALHQYSSGLIMPPFEEEGVYCFAHVGWSVRRLDLVRSIIKNAYA